MTARFVIESPFQLLMALEAADHHGIEAHRRQLIVLWPGETANRHQIAELVSDRHWGCIIEVPTRRASSHLARSRAVRQLAGTVRFDHLFIGDHESPLMRHLANRGRHEALHLLDDGLRTVVVHRQRATGDAPDGRTPAERLARRALARLLRLDVAQPGLLDYFTVFDVDPTGHDTITRNELVRLRSRMPPTAVNPEHCLFLGGPEPELGGMTENAYVEAMRRIRDQLGNAITYSPHRRESPTKLARLEDELSLTVRPARFPIEWELADIAPLPGVVASFLSTALITIPLVVGADVDLISFRLPDDLLIERRRPAVAQAHRTLTSQSRGRITLVDLSQ